MICAVRSELAEYCRQQDIESGRAMWVEQRTRDLLAARMQDGESWIDAHEEALYPRKPARVQFDQLLQLGDTALAGHVARDACIAWMREQCRMQAESDYETKIWETP